MKMLEVTIVIVLLFIILRCPESCCIVYFFCFYVTEVFHIKESFHSMEYPRTEICRLLDGNVYQNV